MDIFYDYIDVTEVNTNEKAINNSIINILGTRIGSLPGKPEFGSRLNDLIFDLMTGTSKELVKRYIIEALLKWEPRIDILNIEVKEIPEYNKLTATVYYQYNLKGQYIDTKTTIVIKD